MAGHEFHIVDWAEPVDTSGAAGVDEFTAMVRDKERNGWQLCGVTQTAVRTRYTFRRLAVG